METFAGTDYSADYQCRFTRLILPAHTHTHTLAIGIQVQIYKINLSLWKLLPVQIYKINLADE